MSDDGAHPVHLRPRWHLPALQRVAPAQAGRHPQGGGVQADVRDALLPALLRRQDEPHRHARRLPVLPHEQVPAALLRDGDGAAPGAQHRPGRRLRPRSPAPHLQQPVRGAGGEEPAVPPPGAGAERAFPQPPRRLRAGAALLLRPRRVTGTPPDPPGMRGPPQGCSGPPQDAGTPPGRSPPPPSSSSAAASTPSCGLGLSPPAPGDGGVPGTPPWGHGDPPGA